MKKANHDIPLIQATEDPLNMVIETIENVKFFSMGEAGLLSNSNNTVGYWGQTEQPIVVPEKVPDFLLIEGIDNTFA